MGSIRILGVAAVIAGISALGTGPASADGLSWTYSGVVTNAAGSTTYADVHIHALRRGVSALGGARRTKVD